MFTGSWLEVLLIDSNKLGNKKYLFGLFLVMVLFVFVAIKEGLHVGMGGDFTVFWYAGKNFIEHNDLYSRIGGAERYIYPPFAAMLFQLLALFSLKTAAVIYTFINLLLFVFIIYLVRTLFELFTNKSAAIRNTLIVAVLLSFRFFLYHIMYVQMNEMVLALSLLGVLLYLRNKETPAIACLVIATFLKVIPVFFLIWIVFRGNHKTMLKIIAFSVLCLLIPLLWRGLSMGMQDLNNYYITFLGPFREGRVEPHFQNYSLSAGIYKISLSPTNPQWFDYNILHLTESTAKRVYLISAGVLFLSMVFALIYVRLKARPVSHAEIAMVLLAAHLLSGITWEYHLVSLIFVYMALLNARNKDRPIQNLCAWALIGLAGLNAIVGRDTVGSTLYQYFGGYGALTWMMVLLFFFFLYEVLSPQQNRNIV